MDEKRDFSNWDQPEAADRTESRKKSSVEREAWKKTAALACLGIASSFLLFCLVAIFNLGKNDSEQTAPGPPEARTSAGDARRTAESTYPGTPRKGRLTAITYSADKPSAVVDLTILHEGDMLHGIEVVEIERGKVHFDKNGERWEQTVGETPPIYWK